MIHIGRARAILGQFTEDEARNGLRTGRFSPTDLGWQEGMENWTPLSQFEELTAPPTPLPPLPSESGPPPYIPEAEAIEIEGLPWEVRGYRGPFLNFFATARQVLFSPREAFFRMRKEGHIAGALLYNLIGGWIGVVAASVNAIVIAKMGAPKPGTPMAQYYQPPEVAEAGMRTFFIMGPVVVTLMVLGAAVLAHLFLMVAGGANKPFHVTLRVMCYSLGSALLLYLFPLVGGPMAIAWLAVCCTIGLRVAHETTTGRAVATVVLMGAAGLAGIIGIFMLAAAAGGMTN